MANNAWLRRVLLSGAFATLPFGSLGCEVQSCEGENGNDAVCAKSLERFVLEDGEITPAAIAYAAGTSVSVHGIYGDIDVVEGTSGEVGLRIEPFTYRAFDAEEEAREELENGFDYTFEDRGGEIVVTTGRHDSSNGLGAAVRLYLPPEFDGALVVENDSNGPVNPGNIDVRFVGQARSVEVSTDSLGDCHVGGEASVVSTRAHCDGNIQVTGVSNDLDVISTGLAGEIIVILREVDDAAAGGKIESEDGDVRVTFPEGADFTVQAASTEDGMVLAPSLDAECVSAVAAETAKSYTCGEGGPNYVVTAGKDGVGPSSVTLDYGS
jgi:hypothetical protein